MKLAIDTYFVPILLQSDPNRIGRTMGAINKAVQGNNFAKCAVETALVDALGKRSRLTVAELMGGRVHDRLPVAWTLASGDTATDIAEAEEMLARRRHNIFKLKIGRGDPRNSIAHVAAIKKALGGSGKHPRGCQPGVERGYCVEVLATAQRCWGRPDRAADCAEKRQGLGAACARNQRGDHGR